MAETLTSMVVSPREAQSGLEPQQRLQIANLYREHRRYTRLLLRRLLGGGTDVEDLLHEVFIVAQRKLPEVDLHETPPHVWLASIALRLAANTRRRHWARRVILRQVVNTEWEPVAGSDPERDAAQMESTRRLQGLLNCLPEKLRVIFILFELQELSGAEIAKVLGCPVKTVYSRLERARIELAKRHAAIAACGRGE